MCYKCICYSFSCRFKQHATKAAKLKLDVDKGNETIGVAENMIGKLEGEYEGWSSQVTSA